MEKGKRKRRTDGDVIEKKGKSEEIIGGKTTTTTVTATEDEVEEFFAILKRIHVAANYFKNKNGGNRELTAKTWRAVVKGQSDAMVLDGDNGVDDETESINDNRRGLDLNLEPPPPHSDDF
ncbi:hypothetical protein CsatB_022052 [Cannabis sativa]